MAPSPNNGVSQELPNGIKKSTSAQGFATVLAIGTALPPNVFYQDDYPDFYFKVTNSDHKTELKEKFKRICAGSKIKKRHLHLTEEIMKEFPDIANECMTGASLDVRQEIMRVEIPKLAKEASLKAIEEWGQPKSEITHLVVSTLSCLELPGIDHHLAKLLGLNPTVHRFGLYNHGCYAGASALRLAKDIADNNPSARILIASSEMSSINITTGPSDDYVDALVCQAIFSDGASAVIVGLEPDTSSGENPLFEIVSACQTVIPDSDYDVHVLFRQVGPIARLSKRVPELIASNIEECLETAFAPFGVSDWNSLFWIVHPGGPEILHQTELKLGLTENKMDASYKILSEYGNVIGACLYFVMDEMRKKSIKEAKSTTGEGLEWGVAFGFGPGLTIEALVLRSVPINMETRN
ncbi:hypothetical protein MKW94_006306 [Papaver nudicaule]|uniref:Chalcone synthase n=1 Tax=Papaver nudicaule TaxID=74823 RepID=A0AA41RNH2_PAPNU|nr:hypothetical protein [Papaver nudicaule]